MTKLPLKFLDGLKLGVYAEDGPGTELVVLRLPKKLYNGPPKELFIPPGPMIAYVGAEPHLSYRSDGWRRVDPVEGTLAIVTLPDPGMSVRVFLVPA